MYYTIIMLCCRTMPPVHMCDNCGRTFPRQRAVRRHARFCAPPPVLHPSDLSPPPDIVVDVPEAATRRDVTTQTLRPEHRTPLDAISPSRRVSRARRQLIRPLLDAILTNQRDVSVGTDTSPLVTPRCVLCSCQTPDFRPAPHRQVSFVQESVLARPELMYRLCRCRVCIQHSLLARRRLGHTARLPAAGPLHLVDLPVRNVSTSSSSERQRLRRLHSETPSSVVCLCTCLVCIAHRTLDIAAEAVVHLGASLPPPEGGGCRGQRA